MNSDHDDHHCDILVVGAGAAGLFAALTARGALDEDGRRRNPPANAPHVVLLNNEARLGLKILVSGGGRCNVSNAHVDEGDYETDTPRVLKGLLRQFPVESIRTFFESRGCRLQQEALGKLFPCSGKASDVLQVLLDSVERAEIPLIAPAQVDGLIPPESESCLWTATLTDGSRWRTRRLILATGGKSLPKTGSRGFGLTQLAHFGHTMAPPVPALTSMRLHPDGPLAGLAGLTVAAVLTLSPTRVEPEQLSGARHRPLARAAGSLLVTHKGATGPVAFDVSGACQRALDGADDVTLRADFWSLTEPAGPWSEYRGQPKPPGACVQPTLAPRPPTREIFEAQAQDLFAQGERNLVVALSTRLPRALVEGLVRAAGLDPDIKVKQIDTRERRQLFLVLTQADLRLQGTDGYEKAEVTAGGVHLAELDRRTLESRLLPGLHCCGEVVNVTGRLGGFNFQWAWSSGYAAGMGAAIE